MTQWAKSTTNRGSRTNNQQDQHMRVEGGVGSGGELKRVHDQHEAVQVTGGVHHLLEYNAHMSARGPLCRVAY